MFEEHSLQEEADVDMTMNIIDNQQLSMAN
jgi:hypothetical protein